MWYQWIIRSRAFSGITKLATRPYDVRNKTVLARSLVGRPFTVDAHEPTIRDVIERWSRRFENEGIPEPVESIEHIVAHVIGTRKVMDVLNGRDKCLSPEQSRKLESLCECRLMRMPVQYIIREWDFRDITLKLIPPIFIPRPETEILVDFVLKRLNALQGETCDILEVGCGSGAISLALAHATTKVRCVAIDTNLHACELARENRSNLRLDDRVILIHATLKEDGSIDVSKNNFNDKMDVDLNSKHFDFLVSNPPYIPTSKIPGLAEEIRLYEDLRAVDGGEDGLKIVKPLLKYAAAALKPGGRLFVEIDPEHPEYINFFTKKYPILKLKFEYTHKDFCNKDRFVEILKLE